MYASGRYIFLLSAVYLGVVLSDTERQVPVLHALDRAGHGVRGYHGIIQENERAVALSPPLRAASPYGICGYKIYKTHSGPLPFEVELKDRETGEADIIVSKDKKLNFEKREKYKFQIAAKDCSTPEKVSEKYWVHIHVEEINLHAPEWPKESYLVKVLEGRIYDKIIQVKATDKDVSQDYHTICSYHILTPQVPFSISKTGMIKNTEALDYDKKHNFILEVQAEDCGGRKSKSLMVNIAVLEICKPGWKGISDRIEYTPGSGRKILAPQASLDLCDEPCKASVVSAHVKLSTTHIGKGCDRDTYSIQSQRKLCGASSGSVDLLPPPDLGQWTKHLPTDDGHEADQIYAFDGRTNAVEVSSKKFNHSLANHFTISTWMKHSAPKDVTRKGVKEHILCNSDGEKMNRHHYSLFVHNCRLVYLMRQEPGAVKVQNTFKPAEWRWDLDEVCDSQWHHYAISVDFPQIRLYVDGKLFVGSKDNPEVIDDWPLHKSRKIHFTRLVVGACWQGGEEHLDQHFKGYLAGLAILQGKTESDRVIKCLNNCKEKLDFHAMEQMNTGMSITFNSEMSEITINGHNASEVQRLVRNIGYVNSRIFPTPGHRNLKVQTVVTCGDNSKAVKIPDMDSIIMVLQAEKPIITITGTSNIARSEHDLQRGEKIFKDIHIVSKTKKEEEEKEDSKEKEMARKLFKGTLKEGKPQDTKYSAGELYKLDKCTIKAYPPLVMDKEILNFPKHLMAQLGLEAVYNDRGLVISGADKIYNYVDVIRQVHYINKKPEQFNSRTFVLTCSELNDRFLSNEMKVKLDFLHSDHRAVIPQAHIQNNAQHMRNMPNIKELHLEEENSNSAAAAFQQGSNHASGSVGMTVIIVVCVGFLIFMIVLGVIRIRAAHNSSQEVAVDEKQEMEWDHSALTITVNPMEQEGPLDYEDQENRALRGEDSDSDDDASSYHDELESSEDESEKIKDRELEWDDSTLSF